MEDVPVEISYHRQKSSTARIRSGRIILRISNLVTRREQQRHIDELLGKMQGQWERVQQKEQISLRGVFVAGQQSVGDGLPSVEPGVLRLSTGIEYAVRVKKGSGRRAKLEKIGNTLHLLWPADKDFDAEEAEQVLWKFLARDQVLVLSERLRHLRQGWMEEDFSTVKLKQVMSRWGSCDKGKGIIMLSVKLLVLEPKLLDYVCVHELAHLRFADHSDLFWDLVAKKMPDWKQKRRKLRQFE